MGARTRLAVECDGDRSHGPDAHQRDMARQRELERCGWHFAPRHGVASGNLRRTGGDRGGGGPDPRQLEPRTFDQVPPAELAHVMREAAARVGWEDLDTVFRETMARFGVRRMGSTVRARLQSVVALARTAAVGSGS